MRNLSKVLALVLSLAFVLTMFAGAIDVGPKTYADSAELTSAGNEAVAVLSALGIVDGYPDGEFKPADDVTRAEFAKMLSVAVAGTDVKNYYATTALPFSDEFDAWCIPYVNFAYLNEIMVGYGDNTMRPKNNVTGFEAVKMVLVGLGYDPKVEGLEGPQWQNNTAKLANRIGLLKNLEAKNLYGAFDREATAILVRNAIYTETVEYVGSYANGSGMTLGEKVFDLIDVRGIVVANEFGAIGLNWEDVLTAGTNYNKNAYIQYTQPNKGETRFAYRDYTGAATEGGYYVPRVITTKIASDNADLGKAFRVLATGAKNPTNTNEIRKVYGILGEIPSDASYVVKTSGIKTDYIDAMLAAAKLITAVTEDDAQGNIFIDGKPASYAAAKALIKAQGASTAPYYYVDNDADGIYDFVYLYSYAAAKVLKVNGKDVTLAGVGTLTLTEEPALAEGDFVAYWGDKQFDHIKKLDTFTGKVTDYTLNSGNGQLTYAGGKYKINGNAYTFGWLSDTFTADERVYFQQLLGLGSSAVADATLKFVFDGSYIVAVFVVEETHWDNYAIVIDTNEDGYLGMQHVRLLTEDNEYKDFYVASYNGKQVYNTIVAWDWVNPNLVNNLVRYEEIGNNQIALYTANYQNASYAYANDQYMYFDQKTGMWEGHDYLTTGIQNGTLYNWENGVVFVTYGDLLSTYLYSSGISTAYTGVGTAYTALCDPSAFLWRAYLYGEFQPADVDEATPLDPKIPFFSVAEGKVVTGDEVVYATALNGVRTLKAAAITFNYGLTDYVLPGLPIRAGQAIWGTVMSATSIGVVTEEGKAKYAYVVEILNPWSTSTTKLTVYEDFKLTTFVKGNLYKMYTDGDGIVRRWEQYGPVNGVVYGTDGLEVGKYVITAVVKKGDGYIFQAKKIIPVIDPITGDPTGQVAAEEVVLTVTKDTDLYFVKKLFTTGIEAVDYVKTYGTLDYLSQANEKGFVGYFDINPTTGEIFSGWINTSESGDFNWIRNDADYTVTATVKVFYNTNNKTATYTLPAGLGATFANGAKSATVKCEPYELLAPIGDDVGVTLKLQYSAKGGWYVKTPEVGDDWGYSWAYYDKYNAAGVVYSASDLQIVEPTFSMNQTGTPHKYYLNSNTTAASSDTQGFYCREGNYSDVYAIYGDLAALSAGPYFKSDAATGIGYFTAPTAESQPYAYNPDSAASAEHAYNYEKFAVMYNNVVTVYDINGVKETEADAVMVVYVDTDSASSAHSNGSLVWPFA